MSNSCISVIIPVYNGERFLTAALESVFAQTLQSDEIIVIDDGSTDRTQEILGTFSDRIHVHHQPKNGPASARNVGLGMFTSDYIAFLDADDLWLPTKLEKQIKALEARPSAMFATTQVKHFLEDGCGIPHGFNPTLLDEDVPGPLPSTFFGRRKVFDVVGLFDEAMPTGEDTDWFARARDLGIGEIAITEALVRKRVHNRNISSDAANNVPRLLDVVRASLQRKNEATERGDLA